MQSYMLKGLGCGSPHQLLNTMKRGHLTLLVLAVFCWDLPQGQQRNTKPATTVTQVCGSQLADTLDLVCNGRFYYAGQSNSRLDKRQKPLGTSQAEAGSLFLQSPDTLQRFERPRRSIVQTCCENPCSLEELSKYCADEADVDQLANRLPASRYGNIRLHNVQEASTTTTRPATTSIGGPLDESLLRRLQENDQANRQRNNPANRQRNNTASRQRHNMTMTPFFFLGSTSGKRSLEARILRYLRGNRQSLTTSPWRRN